jgi:hypothetical protein
MRAGDLTPRLCLECPAWIEMLRGRCRETRRISPREEHGAVIVILWRHSPCFEERGPMDRDLSVDHRVHERLFTHQGKAKPPPCRS